MSPPLLVPVQLDAFVLNPKVCGEPNDGNARICPITQPNYTFLRFNDFVAQSDVQGHADLHNTAPADINTRMTDLGTYPGKPRRNRHGVYLHWTLPRAYRAGVSSTSSVPPKRRNNERLRHGLPGDEKEDEKDPDSVTPDYIQPPTRWMVVRRLDLESIQPPGARGSFQEYDAWVIESDYEWNLDNIPADYDLQVDVSPFIVGAAGEEVDVKKQAEVFIGRKTPLKEWKNEPQENPPNISLLRSGNQLFADFQLHNSNVFSMVDNFQYGNSSDPKDLQAANADYYLIGWHTDEKVDPLWMEGDERPHSERLEALFMSLQNGGDWLAAKDPVRLVCHGAMYDVNWNHEEKPKAIPANTFSKRLQNQKLPATSVGTTPLDALISYCTARKEKGSNTDAIAKLEEYILAIQSLMHARDDGVEGQREAKDTVYNWNFVRAPGGIQYFLADDESKDKNGQPIQPDEASQKDLNELNQTQRLFDACQRASLQLRWDMFSTWWKYFSDPTHQDTHDHDRDFQDATDNILKRIKRADQQMTALQRKIESMREKATLKKSKSGTLPFYYRAADPTLLIGGIDQGWPSDYLDKVTARLPKQAIDNSSDIPDGLSALINLMKERLNTAMTGEMLTASEVLLKEFFELTRDTALSAPPAGKIHPQFHDKVDGYPRDRSSGRQPWRPLYMEWEAEYTHIPFEHWSLDEYTKRVSDVKQVRYGINSSKPLWEELGPPSTHDTRILSGRVLVLPQPSFSLDAKIKQLFSDTSPSVLDKFLKKKERDELSRAVKTLPYLSAPLTGFTDGLLTMAHGTHIKPLNKEIGGGSDKFTAIGDAILNRLGFTKENLEMIYGQSALTPYAGMVAFTDDHCPFKPVTHGQFRFRKLNIIDKFGQTLVGIDPQPRKEGPPPMYPSISDFFEPQTVDSHANTVIKNNEGLCEFIQVPPQINQNSRLNAEFVKRTLDENAISHWRPASEWENPIWGWVVTNYADQSLQFFLPNGTFYREVRIGGPNGVLEEPKWVPFIADANEAEDKSPDRMQFDALINKLSDKHYIKEFWKMVEVALNKLPPPPSSYAQYLTAIVGKPLALVNMGWSLELDQQPLSNQSTNSKRKEPLKDLLHYQLQVKLGDKEREYDGLVAYFDLKPQPETGKPEKGSELNLDTIHTYFTSLDSQNPIKEITSEDYPTFTPFWQSPLSATDETISPAQYDDQRNSHLQVLGALVDPFTAVHAYSSFLPARALQLAPWTWQEAMKRMTAFFHAGPVTLTKDVQDYDASRPLTLENSLKEPPVNVALPALDAGEWNWLQAYVDPASAEHPPVFNSYGIDKLVNWKKPGFENGPYTAVEGFLQLRRPIMEEREK
ncbi:hypothetical protein ASPWEDRAFT_100772 [Aspergillus wentii DTO 134E9]|uniref:Uncharacterized protein n=1 Tax=Aspergillus wentii DTO 134E9 TaxID=1073089 RepID=A0A1L9RYU0_ASPWE|nr:uncharacterized protein ASPWEDRAFT_100772 [Aspergillus wentii DTO 134E9]KAI9932533.1 hypothetical protein MW887_008775 [Aspergillus wentii]OJJ40099.1 hypothetical protein ASPWEDRAFT_100772 [Aspergillus wentii DTO 134E9]